MWPEAASDMAPTAPAAASDALPVAAMPRVLHLITTLDRGGTEAMVLTLARAQRALGCWVEVAVLTRRGAAAVDFDRAGLTVHELGLRRKLAPLAWLRLRRLLDRGDFDILHTHLDLSDLYGPFATRHGRPLVFSSRHNTDDWRRRAGWKRLPFLAWERAAQRRTAATLAVSAAVRDFLVRHEGLDPARFAVVPNGIDLERLAALPDRTTARSRLARVLRSAAVDPLPAALAEGGRPLALFAGRLAPQKGADVLIEALALGGDGLDVVLLGDGPDAGSLRARVGALGLSHRVAFAGWQSDLASLLPAADLFVMPSRWEGFGLAAVEAMAAGLPVVASACDGLREVVEDGVTGRLAAPGDAGDLAAALSEVLGWPQRGAAAGRRGRERARALFGAGRMASAVLEQYRRALAGLPPRPGDGSEARGPAGELTTLVLADRQIRGMWRGILPPRLLRLPPGEHLRAQQRDYRAVADQIEAHAPLAGRRLLDLGCGLGTLLLEARRRGARVAGIEPEAASLALGAQRLGERPPLAAAVGEALPFGDASLDVVACCSVLEHVADPAVVMAEVARVLRPGGWLYLGVPNALRFQERHYKVFLPPGLPRPLARAYLRLRRRRPDFLDTLHEMTPRRALALVRSAGLEVVSDPIARGLARLESAASGGRRPRRPGRRLLAALLRLPPARALARALVRRGLLVDGAILARRPVGREAA